MFEDLYDALSYLWSWNWPTAQGQITEVLIERVRHTRGGETVRLSVTYQFSVGTDGPFTGESFWAPAFFRRRQYRGREESASGLFDDRWGGSNA